MDGKPPLPERHAGNDLPISVRDAATYLGVTVQTIYLWVKRKQILHLRVINRSIRFLKSDLEDFRDSFKQLVNRGAAYKHDGIVYQRKDGKIWWIRSRDRDRKRRLESKGTEDWHEANLVLRDRLQARDNNSVDIVRKGEQLTFNDWDDFFPEHYSQPPIRVPKTHEANETTVKSLRPAFGNR
jgi:excisionase family DNA binding protein